MSRVYGWKPDLPDHRDVPYRFTRHTGALPPSVDLSAKCPPVYDQGQIGSCTANALAAAVEFVYPGTCGSRLFIYWNERVIEGSTDEDAGAQLRDGVKTLRQFGICPEHVWPYDTAVLFSKPTADCYALAQPRAISTYRRLQTVDDMLHCLADGFPFVFGFSVYDGFESAEVAQSGIVNMPLPNEQMLGGHAVLAVGYDQAAQRFKVRNSWGTAWGAAGSFTMPYAYLASRQLSDDFWTVRA